MRIQTLRPLILTAALLSLGAGYRTQNFYVVAPTEESAREVGRAAESLRGELARDWLDQELPGWREPCVIYVRLGSQWGPSGETNFQFSRNGLLGLRISLRGTLQRVLDTVLPHEIMHTVLATHFGRPLPRWLDEGASTVVEHEAATSRHEQQLGEVMRSGRGIELADLLGMNDYPRDLLPLYLQGTSLVRFLIARGSKQQLMAFVGDGVQADNWPGAMRQHYGYDCLGRLQHDWLAWALGPDADAVATK